MSRAPRNSPITEHQWEHIFGILDGACYGSNAVQVAWMWLRSNGCVMQLPTFYERLRKERRARNETAAAGAADPASTSAAHAADRGSADGDGGSSNVQNGKRARDESDADADHTPKAARSEATDAEASSSASCPNEVDQVIHSLKTGLPQRFWP